MSHRGLQLNEDIQFQRRLWKVQRVGWVMLALAVLAALLGVFGHGPFSRTTTATDQPRLLWIEYERFERYDTPSVLHLHIGAGVGHDGLARIQFDSQYLSNIQIQEITPAPVASEATPEGTAFIFRIAASNQPALVTFVIKIQYVGFLSGHIRVPDVPALTFRHFIYP
jgi:hypothetical protein